MVLGHDKRRAMKLRACASLKKSKAFVSLLWDGKGEPVFHYDVKACDDPNDVRHILMQVVAEFVEHKSGQLHEMMERKRAQFEQSVAAAEYREKRSEELQRAAQ